MIGRLADPLVDHWLAGGAKYTRFSEDVVRSVLERMLAAGEVTIKRQFLWPRR